MDDFKTQVDSKLDLTLYIEGLFQREDDVLETKTETVAKTELFADFVDIKTVQARTETDVAEQLDIPDWAQAPFKCLLIKTAGMNFMIPALTVSYIEQVKKNIIRIPLERDAFQGVISLRGQSVAVIDLFKLVSGHAAIDNRQTSKITTHKIEHVMVMENASYALACDEVSEMITLEAEDVRWNKKAYASPFYTGVVKEYLCPLINVDTVYTHVSAMSFVHSLNKQD